jgi:hypothetical protein
MWLPNWSTQNLAHKPQWRSSLLRTTQADNCSPPQPNSCSMMPGKTHAHNKQAIGLITPRSGSEHTWGKETHRGTWVATPEAGTWGSVGDHHATQPLQDRKSSAFCDAPLFGGPKQGVGLLPDVTSSSILGVITQSGLPARPWIQHGTHQETTSVTCYKLENPGFETWSGHWNFSN